MIKRLIAGVGLCALTAVQAMAQSTAPGEVVLRAAATTAKAGAWSVLADAGASGGSALWLPDAGVPKIATASATPRDFFELTFQAKAGVPYRLWFRSRAQGDSWSNDSAFVQFSGSVTSTGTATYRIGSTSARGGFPEGGPRCGEG